MITVHPVVLQEDSVVPVDNGFKQYDSEDTLFTCWLFELKSQKGLDLDQLDHEGIALFTFVFNHLCRFAL